MASYSDVQKAVRKEKRQIWAAWFVGGWVGLGIANATKDMHVVSVITQVLFVGLGVAFTFTAVKMSRALTGKEEAARREVLGDL